MAAAQSRCPCARGPPVGLPRGPWPLCFQTRLLNRIPGSDAAGGPALLRPGGTCMLPTCRVPPGCLVTRTGTRRRTGRVPAQPLGLGTVSRKPCPAALWAALLSRKQCDVWPPAHHGFRETRWRRAEEGPDPRWQDRITPPRAGARTPGPPGPRKPEVLAPQGLWGRGCRPRQRHGPRKPPEDSAGSRSLGCSRAK